MPGRGPEAATIRRLLTEMPPGRRLFRINAGMGWTGKVIRQTDRGVLLGQPRPLHAAPRGWPDLCGWESVEIGPELVGKRLAIFLGIEIKTGSQKLTEDQARFRDMLERMGGIYEIEK